MDPIGLVAAMASTFDALGIPYYLCGSLASAVHGEPRATRDVDFVALIEPAQARPLCAALGDAYYADEASIREAVQRRGHFNVVLLATMMKVDVFVPADRRRFAEEVRRAQRTAFGNASVRVASAEDTVLAKLEWYRLGGGTSDRQWSDIMGVLNVRRDAIDLDYLRREAIDRGLADLLSRALDEVMP